MDLDRLRILDAAYRHGQGDGDIVRAIRSPLGGVLDFPRPGAVTMVGWNLRGLPIEVMIDSEWGDRPVVFHAKPISESRQRELLGERR